MTAWRAGWLLLPVVVAGAAYGWTYEESTIAQPGIENPCVTAGSTPGTTTVIINNGDCVVSDGGNNVSVTNSVTSVSTQNGNSVNTVCINGRCCVQINGAPPTCTP